MVYNETGKFSDHDMLRLCMWSVFGDLNYLKLLRAVEGNLKKLKIRVQKYGLVVDVTNGLWIF